MFYFQDLRYAFRRLARSAGFTLLTVVVLAGGLALSTFTFAFLYTAMLKPLPFPDGDRIVRVMRVTNGTSVGLLDAADLAAMRPSIAALTELGVFHDLDAVLDADGGTRSMSATAAEWNIFEMTRTPPLLGRGFSLADQAPGAEPVVVLTHATWRAAFAEDESVIGRLVRLNGVQTRVVGVMPRGYAFPVATDAYIPIRPEVLDAAPSGVPWLQAYARLAPGVERERAASELTTLLQRARSERPAASSTAGAVAETMTVRSFQLAQIGDEAPLVLIVLNVLAALILLLACINVANLLLARANERARELAVRLALGASRARLIVQTSWETVLLGVAGGIIATVLAIWALNAVNAWAATALEGNLAFWWVWGYDHSVLVGAGAFVTLAVAVLAGVAARRAASTEISAVLQDVVGSSGGRREGRASRLLVIAQVVAVSLVMYFGTTAALLAYRFVNVDFGYDTRNLLSAPLVLPQERYSTVEASGRAFQGLYERLMEHAAIDGALVRAAIADVDGSRGEIEIAGPQTEGAVPRAHVLALLGELTPLGIALRAGRFFDGRDSEAGARTALVSGAFAARYWPGRSPLGESLTLTGLGETGPRTVVGVVDDVLLGNPMDAARTELGVYVPLRQTAIRGATVEFRHTGSEPAARSAYRDALVDVDPLLVSDVTSFDFMLERMTVLATSVTKLFGACFAFALLLAVSGTYGLMARTITRRVREIGVRRALGASDGAILSMLLGEGGRHLGIGAVIALPVALAIGWAFSMVFPISFVASATTAVLVSVTIGVVVLVATWVPARRAIAVSPQTALRRD